MPLLYRRIIFIGFVLLFCILVPVVLIYATGHTINWSRFSLEKTGSILIDSEPAEATIFLNNKQLDNSWLNFLKKDEPLTTKAKIKNLAPGEYTIKLEKAGYWPWEEKFLLAPGEVANFSTIGLFSKMEPEIIYELNATRSELSPNGEKIVLLKKDLLSVIDLTNKIQEIALDNIPLTGEINWSSNNGKITLADLIIELDTKKIIDLSVEAKKAVTLTRWNNHEDMVYFVANNKILRYTISTKIITELSLNQQLKDLTIVDYLMRADQIYIITKQKSNQPKLFIGSMEGKLNSIDLPSGNYKLSQENSPKPVLINGENFYVLDEPLAIFSQPRLLEVSKNFKHGRWQDGSLTYSTGIELRRWDKEDSEYLLSRFGSTINSLAPINKKTAIIMAMQDDIRIYVNGRQPFTISLAPIKNSKLVTVSADAKMLYVYGEYNGKAGIFRLAL